MSVTYAIILPLVSTRIEELGETGLRKRALAPLCALVHEVINRVALCQVAQATTRDKIWQ